MKKMYKTLVLPALAGFLPLLGIAQQAVPRPSGFDQRSPDNVSVPASHTGFSSTGLRGLENEIGLTTYDLQTYDALPRRIAYHGDGKVSAIWMSAFDTNGWPDRGTQFNYRDGSDWGDASRVEDPAVRIGFPTMDKLGDGSTVTIAHRTTAAPPYMLQVNRLPEGGTDWSVSDVPTAIDDGMVWPYMATGGPDGNTIHLIAINFSPDTLREIHYFRSPDGGDTWDVQDFVIPGLDLANYGSTLACTYVIDAHENTVAIAVFNNWADCAVFKSTDNGDTWEEFKVIDFPLPLDYVADTGYDASIVTSHPGQPDPLAIFTSNGNGSVLVDNSGDVHVWLCNQFVIDSDLTNATTEYYPGSNGMAADADLVGLSYWNEYLQGTLPVTIARMSDDNLNGSIDLTGGLPEYWGNGFLSFPQAAVEEDNNLYVVYSAIAEGFKSELSNNHYRHVYVLKSDDGGTNWTAPIDLINPEMADEDVYLIEEAAYPAIARDVDDRLRIIYQRDFIPDIYVEHVAVGLSDNTYIYLELNKDLGLVSPAKEISKPALALSAQPNPASCKVTLAGEGLQGEVTLKLFDATGRCTFIQNPETVAEKMTFDVSGLVGGLYLLHVSTEKGIQTLTIMVE